MASLAHFSWLARGGSAAFVALAAATSVGCHAPSAGSTKAAEFVPVASPPQADPAASRIRYSVVFEPEGLNLAIEAVFPTGTPSAFAVENGSERWLEGVLATSGQGPFTAASVTNDGVVHARCDAGCTLRYRYSLGASGRARRDIDSARTDGPYVEAPPSTWLLAPIGGNDAKPLEFTVHMPHGSAFVSGLPAEGGGARLTTVGALRSSPYSAFGPFDVVVVDEPDVSLSIALPRKGRRIAQDLVVAWAKKSAAAVRSVLGKFPAKHAALLVSVNAGDDVEVGFSLAGSSIVLRVGERTTARTFANDWVLTHEMLHFACPSQPDARDWAEEGLATYVEPFARVRAGLVTREEAWRGLVRGFPYGQPERGDQGLDRTRTWGRVYWGGALFYFEADYAIRVRTAGKKTLFDALAAIVASGGTNASGWSLERAFAVGDEATGVPVLTEMLARYGETPTPFAYEAHLAELGVTSGKSGISFLPTAPRAPFVTAW